MASNQITATKIFQRIRILSKKMVIEMCPMEADIYTLSIPPKSLLISKAHKFISTHKIHFS